MKDLLEELGSLAAPYGTSNLARAYKTFCKREGIASPDRKPMNRLGKVGRQRLDVVAELDEQWSDAPWYSTCEIRPVLMERAWMLHGSLCRRYYMGTREKASPQQRAARFPVQSLHGLSRMFVPPYEYLRPTQARHNGSRGYGRNSAERFCIP